ncbi:hypothetical protein [Pseudanabaena sp. BC1403]|uniref:hypothetical protein n=1 Tax=Pseudanabaena sp. BC1403 TaxID=2043171 RepID=UPI0015E180AA|nr:hypothetical protein [Pseudanabaena sp. BC1403]
MKLIQNRKSGDRIVLFLMNRRSLFGDLNKGAIALFLLLVHRRSHCFVSCE